MEMNKIDKYIKETLLEILEEGQWDKNSRTRWSDGTVAYSKFVTQKVFQYDISKNQFPITTLRTTALKGAFYDIEAIYIKQTNILEEMHPSIYSWWSPFIVKTGQDNTGELYGSIGRTYGNTVRRYGLMNNLLKGLEENPFGRRHIIDMWQEQQMIVDPKALVPCAYSTLWSVREVIETLRFDNFFDKGGTEAIGDKIRYIDLTLMQRSMDFAMTSSINPIQYVMLGMMVANHLTFKTGIKHKIGKFLHIIQNCHIYDRHQKVVEEILDRRPTGKQPKVKLVCKPKDFYEHTFEDFEFEGLEGIEKLKNKIEIAV